MKTWLKSRGLLAVFGLVFALADGGPLAHALEYLRHDALSRQLRELAAGNASTLRVQKLAESRGQREVWLAELGRGGEDERGQRPAMLVVAGIEGNDLAGSVSAVAWIEQLVRGAETNDAVRRLLDSTTIYVLPRVNPDAAESYFAQPRLERSTTTRPYDDDRDGLTDEDGADDLDGDGLITWMRVEDPEGEYILDPAEPRLLLKADRAKGEVGKFRLLTEGRDDDKDDAWNEDGLGGVNLNRNFPYQFKFFATSSGAHAVSETETRALAEFIVAHPNIGIVFTFGAADNLTQTPKAEPAKRPPITLHEEDAPVYRELGKAWREALGLRKELPGASEPGTFSDWLYFHRGRLSLAARAWSPALALEWGKASAKPKVDVEKSKDEKPTKDGEVRDADPKDKPDDKATAQSPDPKPAASDSRNEDERAYLKWLDTNAPERFVAWKPIEHPDFPGKKVEVGGYVPFAQSNPPESRLADVATRHGTFLTALAGKLPRLGVRKTEVKSLGDSVFDVRIQIENTGFLPTALAQGQLTREVHPTRVVLQCDEKAILSGTRITTFDRIEGSGGMKEVRVILHSRGMGPLEFEVVSMLGGRLRGTVPLK